MENLPPEMRALVVCFLLRPSDLLSVCLTCKTLRDASTPKLYSSVRLDLERPLRTLDRFASPLNPGLEHVRKLEIYPKDSRCSVAAKQTIRIVIQTLPEHRLVELKLPTETELDYDMLGLLALRQKEILSIRFGICASSLGRILRLPACGPHWLERLVALQLPTCVGPASLRGYGDLIGRCADSLRELSFGSCGKLHELELEDDDDIDDDDGSLQDDDDRDGLLSSLLFHHITPRGPQPALQLTRLTITGTDLCCAARTFMQYIDGRKLLHLNLRGCDNANDMLSALLGDDPDIQLSLKSFAYDGTAISPLWIESLIQACGSLERWYLYTKKADVLLSSLTPLLKHADTLQQLNIRIGLKNGVNYTDLDKLRAVSDLTQLRQLGLRFSAVQLDEFFNRRWDDFEHALRLVACLPKLRMLRCLTWPIPPHGFFRYLEDQGNDDDEPLRTNAYDLGKLRYAASLDLFATAVMQRIARFKGENANDSRMSVAHSPAIGRLPIFCVGDPQQAVQEITSVGATFKLTEPVCYVAAKVVDVFGQDSVIAMRTPLEEIKFMEPQCDILKFGW